MKSILNPKIYFLFVFVFFCASTSSAQKKAGAVVQNNMHSDEETKLLALINEMRNDPKTFASNNKNYLEKNYPEFYLRLTASSKLEPLTEECSFVNVARGVLTKTKFAPCNLPGGHTLAPLLTDESKGDFSSYSDLQLMCAVNFNLLESDPNYIGICLVRNKGIVITLGNYQGEEHTYHAEIKAYKAELAKKNIYLFQHMEPAIERNLVLMINGERQKNSLPALKHIRLSSSSAAAGKHNSLYYNEPSFALKVSDTAGALTSKSAKFASEHSDFIFKGHYKKLTIMEHIVDTVSLAKELFDLFMASEKKSKLLLMDKQTEIGLNVNSSGSNFCLFATVAFSKIPEVSALTNKIPVGDVEPEGTFTYKVNMEILRLINELRQSIGVKTIVNYNVTECAALFHSKYMARTGHFSHVETTPGYEEFYHRIEKFMGTDISGVNTRNLNGHLSENIAWFSEHYFTGKTYKEIAFLVFDAWKHSKGHYYGMTNDQIDYGSIGTVLIAGGTGGYFTFNGMKNKLK
ncbi:MAG: CAP domain-containing protein [Bacteroidia bacterium]|nr:CAP domain-containing protein [Bacteroidia bacterium]